MKRIFTILLLNVLFVGFLSAQKDLQILLVHDDEDATSTTEGLREAITAAGYLYVDYNAVTDGAPVAADLEAYELILWCTGKNYPASRFWDKTNPEDIKATADMISFLDNGGMLWISGLNVLYDAAGNVGAPQTFDVGSFTYDYLGIEGYALQADLTEMLVEADNGICTVDNFAPSTWSYIAYVDHAIATSTAKSIYTSSAHTDTAVMVFNEIAEAKILSDFIRWDAFDANASERNEIVGEILDYFNQYSTASVVDVTSIEITGGTEITENDGTLQLAVTVLPEDATVKVVTWSIKEGSVSATIDQDGLLTASGMDSDNGTVTVVATATDGTDIFDEAVVTISNQALAEGYRVALVNDNDYTTRYIDIDTAVLESGYTYKIYNTAETGEAPSLDYLENFDFVVWYTGNDQTNLHFWDVSDSSDFKCNAALKTYADNGGVVWVQGLDFFYDVYGNKFTYKNENGDSSIIAFEAGDFAYDYLGVKELVTETKIQGLAAVYPYDGVPQLDITEENTITTIDPIEWVYTTMWNTDVLDVTDNAVPLYYNGPSTYAFSLYYAMVYNENGNATFITSPFETAKIDEQANINLLFKEVLDYFEGLATSASEISELGSFDLSAYPNPAKDKTFITYSTSSMEEVNLTVYDITGKVTQYENLGIKIAGNHTYELDLSDYIQGVYFYQISTVNSREAKKIIVFE